MLQCLSAWRANMDIQFVLDVYSCAIYIVSYIFKAQKGMSELLRTACEEAKRGNSSIKQQGRDSGVASVPAVPPGWTNNFQKNEEMFYSETKITALLILKIEILIMNIFQCFHLSFI
jgi:hypothetical protein